MTDDLIKQSRFLARDHKPGKVNSFAEVHTGLLINVADALEAQAAEIARLREVLGEVWDWIGSWSPEFIWDDEWLVTEAKARAALGGKDGQ